jgi:DNA-binding FadR family transcriptional regulator
MSETLQRLTVSDQIAAKLKQYIIENNLKCGDRLPTEHELAELFGVSRISVREATKALGFLGIIDAAPRRGLTIARLNMERVSQYLGFHFAVSDYPKEQLIETRLAIELAGLSRAVERMRDEPTIYVRLNAINERLREILENEDLSEWIELDVEFHRELLRASGLEPLVAFHDLLQVFFQRFRSNLHIASRRDGVQLHQEIIDALRAGRLDVASQTLREHIGRHISRWGLAS